MQPIFNTKNMFYDYFNHVPPHRMKEDFGLDYYEQSAIRDEIRKVIQRFFDRLVDSHDLKHYDVYSEIGDEFDEAFYDELQRDVHSYFHDMAHWDFLDTLMKKRTIEDPVHRSHFKSLVVAEAGGGAPESFQHGVVDLKESLVALINLDLAPLSGQELLYLAKLS